MSWLDTLLMPFQFGFMVNAMIIAVLVTVPMALLSCFLVLKGWSLMGDAISHAVFPGVVIAYLVGIPYAIGAFVAGMFCARSGRSEQLTGSDLGVPLLLLAAAQRHLRALCSHRR